MEVGPHREERSRRFGFGCRVIVEELEGVAQPRGRQQLPRNPSDFRGGIATRFGQTIEHRVGAIRLAGGLIAVNQAQSRLRARIAELLKRALQRGALVVTPAELPVGFGEQQKRLAVAGSELDDFPQQAPCAARRGGARFVGQQVAGFGDLSTDRVVGRHGSQAARELAIPVRLRRNRCAFERGTQNTRMLLVESDGAKPGIDRSRILRGVARSRLSRPPRGIVSIRDLLE